MAMSEEDAATFRDNYGIFFKLAGITGPWIITAAITVFLGFQTFCMIVSTIVGGDNLAFAFESAHTACLLAVNNMALLSTKLRQSHYETFWRGIGRLRYDYAADSETTGTINEMRREGSIRKRFAPRLFISMITFLCMATISLRLPFDYLSNDTYVEEIKDDGIIRNLPVAYWHPLDGVNYWVPYIIAAASEVIVIYLLTVCMIGVDSTFCCMASELCTEYEILEYTLINVVSIARRIHDENCKTNGSDEVRELFLTIMKDRMKRCAKHHQQLLSLTETLIIINSWPLLMYTTVYALLMCFAIVLVVKNGVRTSQKITMVAIFIVEMIHVFVYCYFSEKLKEKGNNVRTACYNSNWVECSSALKNDILIIQCNSLKPQVLTAGGFGDVGLETFAKAMQTTYSYINLMMVSSEG